jgi:Ca2+-binding EF-hand superfamily protein
MVPGLKVNEKDRRSIPVANTNSKHKSSTRLLKQQAQDQNESRERENINRLLKNNTKELMHELTPEVRKAFQTLFERIDITESGGITTKEIQNLVKKHTGKTLSLDEVKQVMDDLDVTRTGDIEFDEFIFMLSQPENYVRLLGKDDLKSVAATTGTKVKRIISASQNPHRSQDKNKSKKSDEEFRPVHVFFEALKAATKQDSMTALRTFYRNRLRKLNDHVIHDWSAGQRCIGLSDQEMLKRYEGIQCEFLKQRVNFCRDNSYKQSPYARLVSWGVTNLQDGIKARREQRLSDKDEKINKKSTKRVKVSEFVVTAKAVPLPRYVIRKRSPLKRTFNYDQLADIRQKVDKIATGYYTELKDVARDQSEVVKKEMAITDIKEKSRANFMHTFDAYCAPFVVSPWIPMPSPTLQASFAPLGKSKLSEKTY